LSTVARRRLRRWSILILLVVNSFFGRSAWSAPLTNVQQILALGVENTGVLAETAHLHGVITFPIEGLPRIWVQDATGGLLVGFTNSDFRPAAGQLVEVQGRIGVSLPAPMLIDAHVHVAGTAALPEPRRAQAYQLAKGELNGQWVAVEGVVRDVAGGPRRLILFLSAGGVRFHAVVQPPADDTLPVNWLDARIELHGLCSIDVDRENKPMGFTLYVPGTNHLHFLSGGSTDVFDRPMLAVGTAPELRQPSDSRVKVAGTVLFHSQDGHVFLRDDTGALEARLLVPLARVNPKGRYIDRPSVLPLRPGARIELVGAPSEIRFAPVLRDAELRVIRDDPAPSPLDVSLINALSGRHDRQLISLKGRLLATDKRATGSAFAETLLIQSEGGVFEAVLDSRRTNALPVFPKNARLKLSGICVLHEGELKSGRSLRLLVRDPGEIHYLGQPPLWSSWPVGRILVLAFVLGSVALGWIWSLRRKVHQRTAALALANVELDRTLAAERELGELKSRFVSLVSHEFRTPLGITMSAVELLRNYMERLDRDKIKELFNDIHASTLRMSDLMEQVLVLGRAEAGKISVNAAPLDLPALCRKLADEALSAASHKCRIQIAADSDLDAARGDESLVRHIFSNLLSNAVKYSLESSDQIGVEFHVRRDGCNAVFTVRDRGIGIPKADQPRIFEAFHRASNVDDRPGSGLGLLIVKRCVELHQGSIAFDSHAGQGTRFQVRLPLFASSPR
jgi:signal transduction histidine kinase